MNLPHFAERQYIPGEVRPAHRDADAVVTSRQSLNHVAAQKSRASEHGDDLRRERTHGVNHRSPPATQGHTIHNQSPSRCAGPRRHGTSLQPILHGILQTDRMLAHFGEESCSGNHLRAALGGRFFDINVICIRKGVDSTRAPLTAQYGPCPSMPWPCPIPMTVVQCEWWTGKDEPDWTCPSARHWNRFAQPSP